MSITENKSTQDCNEIKTLSQQKNERYLGLDILKILSMTFIVIYHLSLHGGFYANSTSYFTKVFLTIINAMFWPSVNIFVYISSFLIIKKGKTNIRNFFKLWLEIIFYNVIIYIVLCCFGITPNIDNIFVLFLPITRSLYWFASTYLVLYLISPLLLKIVNNLNKREYDITILAIIIISLCYMFGYQFLPLNDGFNIIWFAILFIISGYQFRFGFNLQGKVKKIHLIIVYVICLGLSIIKVNNFGLDALHNYTHIIALIETVVLFTLFQNIKSNNKIVNKIVKYISTCTFGIYLLHDNASATQFMYQNLIQVSKYYTLNLSWLHFIKIVLLIILCGIVVESLRKLLGYVIKKILILFKNNKIQQ